MKYTKFNENRKWVNVVDDQELRSLANFRKFYNDHVNNLENCDDNIIVSFVFNGKETKYNINDTGSSSSRSILINSDENIEKATRYKK